jgi:general secretion pathway protein I
VLVALAIFAVALAAGFRSVAQSAESATTLKARTLALWVAQNRLAAAQLEVPAPAIGEREGVQEPSGRQLRLARNRRRNAQPRVSPRRDYGGRQRAVRLRARQLVGYIGQSAQR